jgi:iron complex outermembrane receptor protein
MAAALTALPAQAAEADAAAGDDQAAAIIVTAQREKTASLGALGSLDIKDTPFSVSVFDREAIDRIQARSIGDVLRMEPGVTSAPNAGSYANIVEIRGFAIGSLFEGLPNEAGDFTYRRDALFNVGRVEVLRGVSSLVYGGATFLPIGGAVNVTPKYATAENSASFLGGFAAGPLGLAALDASVRVGADKGLGLRFNLGTETGNNVIRGQQIDNTTAAVTFDVTSVQGLVLRGGFEHARNNITGYRDVLGLAPGLAVPAPPPGRTNFSQPWAFYGAESDFGWVVLSYQVAPWLQLGAKGLAGYSRRPYISTFGSIDNAAGDLTIFPTAYDNNNRNESFEASAVATFATGAIDHRVTLAANWARERWYFRTNFDDPGVGGGPISSNLYNPIRVPGPEVTGLARRGTPSFFDIGSGGALIWSATAGPVTLMGGGRYIRLNGKSFNDPVNPERETARYDQSRVTPLAALTWAVTPDLTAYGSFAEGLEQGGIAPLGTINQNQRLPVRATRQFEVGGKWQLVPNLLVTIAAWQVTRPLEFVDFSENPQGRFVQNGRQRHRGVDLGINGKLTPTTFLGGGVTYIDAKALSTADPALAGNRPPGVPEWRLTLTGEQELVAGLSAIATVEHQGAVALELDNSRLVPAWTRLDLGAAWRTVLGGQRVVFRGTVDNVLGRRYWAGSQFGALTFGVPEQAWRVSMQVDF